MPIPVLSSKLTFLNRPGYLVINPSNKGNRISVVCWKPQVGSAAKIRGILKYSESVFGFDLLWREWKTGFLG